MSLEPNTVIRMLPLLALTGCLAAEPEPELVEVIEPTSTPRKGEVEEEEEPIDPDAITMHERELPTLQALTPHEVAELREQAEHTEAEGLDEEDSQGLPAIHYAMLEVRDAGDVERLGQLGIHWDVMPLFEEELEAFAGHALAYVDPPADEVGAYVYAFLPARLYNALVEAQRDGEALFPTMLLRPVPHKDAQESTPSGVSYAWLEAEGFWWDPQLDVEPLPEDAGGPVAVERRALDERVAMVKLYTADTMERIEGHIGVEATPYVLVNDAKIDVRLTLRSTDPVFESPTTGIPRVIRRGWGNLRGRAADIRGANVVARQGANRIRRSLDASNRATVALRRNRATTWCIDLKSEGAKLTTNFWTSNMVCRFSSPADGVSYQADGNQIIDVRNSRVAALAYATDAWSWLQEIAEHDPLRVDILVGPLADLLSVGDTAYATCGSYYGALATTTMGATLGQLAFLGPLVELTLGHVDVVLPTDGLESRGVVAHEYGHFALCSLMAEEAPTRFEFAWSDVILETIVPQALGNARGVEHEASWINEGFADFFAAQVAGGTNYFAAPGALVGSGLAYCPVGSATCLEGNARFPDFADDLPDNDDGLHRASIAAFTTLLLDVVDGHAYPVFDSARDVPGNGGIWSLQSVGGDAVVTSEATGVSPRQNDEVVHATGDVLSRWMQEWKERTPVVTGLDKEDVLAALSAAMRAQGANDSQICRVFAEHAADDRTGQGACLDLLPQGDLEVDPTEIALENGDLLAPTSLLCTTPGLPGDNDLVCHWEDFSIDADGYEYRILVDDTGQLIDEGAVGYAIDQTATLPLPPFVGAVRVEMQTRKGDRLSDATFATTFVEPIQCGDGVIQPGEACDGSQLGAAGAACPTSSECPVCTCVSCLEVEPLCIF